MIDNTVELSHQHAVEFRLGIRCSTAIIKRYPLRILPIAFLAALLLSGCTLSPQTINVTPAITVAPASFGRGHSINVMVQDNRQDATIGSRGGVYRNSSTIQSANDVAEAIRAQTAAGLVAQGYTLAGTEAESMLRIGIDQLSYVVPAGALATSADITATLRIAAQRDNRQLETTYKSTVNRRFPVTPTATQNETWVNEVLNETLQRFFADPKMRAFLTE